MRAHDDGFATVAGAFAVAAITAAALLVLYIGGAVVARHRAQSAVDLAALAAAARHVRAEPTPCAAARRVARAQRVHATVRDCTIDGDDVVVTVGVPVRLGPFGLREATASARAGPVE
ncbi:Rv3654c family TadE-like protein [Gordonia sp. CPCC 206044]|uniref:Rv3654c family TadE-like protein n=1 Tax=Gordonia sp. CPCC 206044 TaxID=3140793 RepID=UPI003AF3DFF8